MPVKERDWRLCGGLLLAGLLLLAGYARVSAVDQAGWTVLQEVTFSVRAGERVSDLADRWQAMGISSRSTVAAVAADEAFARFPLVPPPRPELSRFEGLFLP
jgi:hypothetical protein